MRSQKKTKRLSENRRQDKNTFIYLCLGKALRAFDFAIQANKIGIQNEQKIYFIFNGGGRDLESRIDQWLKNSGL